MNFKETLKYYRTQYNRYKLSNDEINAMISNYRESGSDELKKVLWFNVARLSLDTIFSIIYDRPNLLHDVCEDYIQQAYFTFENSLSGYTVENGTQFNSYFKSNVKLDLYGYYQQHHAVKGIKLGNNVIYRYTNGKLSNENKNSLKALKIDYIQDYKYDDDGSKLDKYNTEGEYVPGTSDEWDNIIKPIIYSKLSNKKQYIYVQQFEEYYFPKNKATFQSIAIKYGISSSAVDLNVKKILKILKEIVADNEEVREILYNILQF